MSEDKFIDTIIHQGEIAHDLSKLKKEELIIGYQREICLTEELQHKIAVLSRALELACGKNDHYIFLNTRAVNKKQKIYDYFISQARKELKDESGNN